ncbi:NADH-quinone oxidoreductase subunit K [Nitrosomonas mobilis]|uniref:NADH-ubiquinone oxidoreductase, chain 4L n=1 Tax=Nitrosomonas mobilis TaxID=51642 RepID=A0A1G5SE79_9PROT|nr:NADH-quinone oxidoreductase subunit K [Nitrosomonas mobilis]SCZ85432.1 NADH-ubiquinone oxidoreductase, chain 4L [Nitrosomonas mobilis]HNO74323.1 NADH-quinone oxidoreductase subunit K [Nitrosomonas mobilis]
MTTTLLYALTGIGLFSLGLHALIVQSHLLHKLLAINVMSCGVFLVLASLAARTPEGSVDPVPHAMVITGIVVAVAATALGLAILLRIHALTGKVRLPDANDQLDD